MVSLRGVYTMQFVHLQGKKIAYAVEPLSYNPSSLSLVFIHGSGGDSEHWRGQLTGLSATATVLAIELPGHGMSDGPGENTVSAYAQNVCDFVEKLELSKVLLIGCSLGSAITQWIALLEKPWLAGIGLVGAGARLRVHQSFLEGLKKDDAREALSLLADFCLSPSTGDPLRSSLNEKFGKTDPAIVYGDLAACNDFDVISKLGEITVPTWILVGRDDRLTPPKYAEFLHKGIPHSVMEIVDDAGHLVSMEAPDIFNERLKSFILHSALGA
jgi:pimeloyl-ACP methyl ester carboxylesterase